MNTLMGLAGFAAIGGLVIFLINRPLVGLFVLVFVTFGAPWELFGGVGTMVRLTGMLVAGSFFLRMMVIRGVEFKFISFCAFPYALYLVWRVIQIIRTNAPEAEVWIVNPGSIPEFLLRLVMYTVLYIIILNLCQKSIQSINVVLMAVVLSVALSSIYSMLIYFDIVSPVLGSQENFDTAGRISGLRGNPTETSFISITALGLVIPFVLFPHQLSSVNHWLSNLLTRKKVVYLITVILIISQLHTGCRSGLIAMILMLTVIMIKLGRVGIIKIVPIALGAILLIGSLVPLNKQIRTRFTQLPGLSRILYDKKVTEVDTSAFKRAERGLAALDIWQNNLLFGAGYGNYELEVVDIIGYGTSAHSLYAEILAEEGLIGFVIYMYLIFRIFSIMWRSHRIFTSKRHAWLEVISFGFILSFLAFNTDRIFGNGDQLNKFIIMYMAIADVMGEKARRLLNTPRNYSKQISKSRDGLPLQSASTSTAVA